MLAAAALATAVLASPATEFRTLTIDIALTHADTWQTDSASGTQRLRFATPKPVRQSIVVYHERGAPPFQAMTNDELTWKPPRAEVERSGCATTRPRVRTRFSVEDELLFTVGHVPRLDEPCPPAEAELALAAPEPLAFPGAARKIKRLRRGGRLTLHAEVERGPDGEPCAPRPAAGPWECATTRATLRVKRVE